MSERIASSGYTWVLLAKCFGAHRWFFEAKSHRVACADASGKTPDVTDDGVLWLNKDLPITITSCSLGVSILVPVVCSTMECTVLSSVDECAYLVRQHGMKLVLQPTTSEPVHFAREHTEESQLRDVDAVLGQMRRPAGRKARREARKDKGAT